MSTINTHTHTHTSKKKKKRREKFILTYMNILRRYFAENATRFEIIRNSFLARANTIRVDHHCKFFKATFHKFETSTNRNMKT